MPADEGAPKLEHDHSPAAIKQRLAGAPRPNYLRDWVYGAIDGAVTTFAIVAGVAGAQLEARIVLILGLANLLADGFSMAASNYSGTKTEIDDARRLADIERRHIRLEPHGEREEIRQILRAKGLTGETLDGAVAAVTSSEKTWIAMMLADEYGIASAQRSPLYSGLSTFAAFLIAGSVPLLPYLFAIPSPFTWGAVMVGIVFFAIGSTKSLWSLQRWYWSGAETLAIGLVAAGVAYGVGSLFSGGG